MLRELFTVPLLNFSVHSYGLMLVLGLFLGIELAKFLARRSGIRPELFANAAVLALISGLIGARIAYVLQFPKEVFVHDSFLANAWSAINLTSGGLVYYGGFLLATATLIAYAIYVKIPVLRGMDIIAPCLMIGLAFGRIGCFLNGCCWGEHCELPSPVAVQFPYYSGPYIDDFEQGFVKPNPLLLEIKPDGRQRLIPPEELKNQPALLKAAANEHSARVINTQLISTVTALMIAVISFGVFTLYRPPGQGFAVMLVLEGFTRFLIEGLRVEPPEIGPLTLSMIIGLGLVCAGIALWFIARFFGGGSFARPGYPDHQARQPQHPAAAATATA